MTREIALHCMKSASELERELCEECPIYGQTGSDHCFEDALQYVIGMLEQEPTTKNDLGVDCISRAEAIKCLECDFDITGKENMKTVVNYINSAHDKIVNLPRVKQEPKTGHWKDIPKYKDIAWCCSECERFTTMKHNYCPKCGAKMVEPQESEGKK